MIEYALKPLWDPDIPLELFMPKTEANNFREYLRNATITQLAGGASCKDEFVGDCYGTGGICLPKYDPESGVYDFECANPEREGRKGLFEYDVYVFGLEVKDYGDRTSNFPTWWGHHTPSYAPPQIRRQNGIFGYNQATIEVSGEDDTTPRVCEF